MRLYSRASSRTSSSSGATLGVSAATAIEDLLGVGEVQVSRTQQDREVVEDVRRLLGHALVALVGRRPRHLVCLLTDLLPDPSRVLEQAHGVGAVGTFGRALGQGALKRGQRLAGRRLHVAPVEAGPLAGVAG